MAIWYDRFAEHSNCQYNSVSTKRMLDMGDIVVCINGKYYRPISGTATVGAKEVPQYVFKVLVNERYRIAETSAPSTLIKKVHFNPPATVVLWADGTKTVVKTQDGEDFDPEKGLAMAIAKKAMGNQGNYYEVFKKWCYPWYAQEAKNTIIDEEFWKNFRTAMSLIGKGVDI